MSREPYTGVFLAAIFSSTRKNLQVNNQNQYKMLGISVMLGMLSGNEDTVNAIKSSLNKVIESVTLVEDEKLLFKFIDRTRLTIWDNGQSCCEHRYMKTDDDLNEFSGAVLLDFELKSADPIPDEYGEHEVQFLDVKTTNGTFQVASHNEHNGYYGGFNISASVD